jgi:hypothetical protein
LKLFFIKHSHESASTPVEKPKEIVLEKEPELELALEEQEPYKP